MSERIHLSRAQVGEVEERFVLDALRSGWIAPLGPFVDRFEREIAERLGVAGALALSSGTAALHLALLHAGAAPGRSVVLPSLTFIASANAVVYTGATPVFVDSVATDGNVDVPLLLEAVRTLQAEGHDVAAVLSVDLLGRAADYSALEPGLAGLGVPLVEDAAEALGAVHRGRAAGAFGQSAALSFNGNKIMTTSGGGMLLSDDPGLIERARYLSTQARQPVAWYEHTESGFNYRMSNILAALGVGQLSRLDEMVARRREIRARYRAAFAEIEGIRILGAPDPAGDDTDNCWLTAIVLDPDLVGARPDTVIGALGDQQIEARHLWQPMHLQPVFEGARMFDTEVGARLFETSVTLPSGAELSDEQIDRVISAVRESVGGRS